jgi:hypothetical protein
VSRPVDVRALMEAFDGCGGPETQRDLTADEHYAVAVEELRYANELDSLTRWRRGRVLAAMARAQVHAALAAAGGAR